MVSIFSMPATVSESYLLASRIRARAMFTRLADTARDTSALMTMVASPTAVSTRLWRTMSAR